MPPKILAKNNDRPSGVLAVSGATRAATAKAPTARLKLEIRRLPPGLTLTEFEEILGPEWKLGAGKVDWREYRQGKMKMAIGKVPEQSRCYVHLVSESLVRDFEARFLQVVFHDKAGTHKSLDIRHLPPTVGFAPNQRTPITAKTKVDPRQGTIDQDPEFIRFLEAETQPITKPAALDAVGVEKEKVEKVETTSTPLIEAIREKKANKAKAAAAKEEKRDGKSNSKTDSKDPATGKGSGRDGKGTNSQKVEQASKEAAKAINKHVTSKQQPQRPASPQQAQSKVQASPAKGKKSTPKPQSSDTLLKSTETATTSTSTSTTTPQRTQRHRGNPESIKKLIQKDLGLKPKAASAARETPLTASQAGQANAAESKKLATATPKSTTAQLSSQTQQVSKGQASSKPQAKNIATSVGSRAYIKHANPSQGMTEALIQQALSQYGELLSVTIDSRKGTATAVFKDHESLGKAMAAKKIQVAEGTVEVLEFRDRAASSGGKTANKGGRGGGRGNKGGAQPNPAPTAVTGDKTS